MHVTYVDMTATNWLWLIVWRLLAEQFLWLNLIKSTRYESIFTNSSTAICNLPQISYWIVYKSMKKYLEKIYFSNFYCLVETNNTNKYFFSLAMSQNYSSPLDKISATDMSLAVKNQNFDPIFVDIGHVKSHHHRKKRISFYTGCVIKL